MWYLAKNYFYTYECLLLINTNSLDGSFKILLVDCERIVKSEMFKVGFETFGLVLDWFSLVFNSGFEFLLKSIIYA